jgi:hypothetical protein
MKLEIRIPISPEPHFFRQVEYITRACAALGGSLGEARILVSVGADCEPRDLYRELAWSLGRVEWSWVDRELFRRESFHATGKDRFKHPTDADYVLLLDADTLIVRGFEDLLMSLAISPSVAGVMAHVPPFNGMKVNWRDVFAALGQPFPSGRFEHTGWGTMYGPPVDRFGPIYYNFGVVFVPGPVLLDLGAAYVRQFGRPAPIHPYFVGQLAFTLAIYELGLPHVALPLRYNFPNYVWADQRQAQDLADVRIIHYMSEETIGTRRDTWGIEANFQTFLARTDLVGANETLRRAVATLATMPVTVKT